MGLFSFIKEAGEKLFGKKQETPEMTIEDKNALNQERAQAIFDYVKGLNLQWSSLMVSYKSGQVAISGTVPDQENREKIILAAGNVEGVDSVDDQLVVEAPAAEPRFYTVVKGDTLWKIAASQYGDGSKYPRIFEANKPMLKDPNKIYPGQNLRFCGVSAWASGAVCGCASGWSSSPPSTASTRSIPEGSRDARPASGGRCGP